MFQFSWLIQCFILGGFNSPWIRPAFFNSLRCCKTVDWAKGNTSTKSPVKQPDWLSRCFKIAIRVGCPKAWANFAKAPVSSLYYICSKILFTLFIAKIRWLFVIKCNFYHISIFFMRLKKQLFHILCRWILVLEKNKYAFRWLAFQLVENAHE